VCGVQPQAQAKQQVVEERQHCSPVSHSARRGHDDSRQARRNAAPPTDLSARELRLASEAHLSTDFVATQLLHRKLLRHPDPRTIPLGVGAMQHDSGAAHAAPLAPRPFHTGIAPALAPPRTPPLLSAVDEAAERATDARVAPSDEPGTRATILALNSVDSEPPLVAVAESAPAVGSPVPGRASTGFLSALDLDMDVNPRSSRRVPTGGMEGE